MNKFSLDIPSMGYFLLYRSTSTLIHRLIEKRQLIAGIKPEHACYIHIEIAGPQTKGIRYSVDVSPPLAKMVDIVKRHKGKHLCVLRYDNEHYERMGRFKIAYFSATRCNKIYDIPGILAFIFKWIKQNNKLWFCSEGALWALKKEYPRATIMLPHQCMPGHFFGFRKMVKHWEGIIE